MTQSTPQIATRRPAAAEYAQLAAVLLSVATVCVAVVWIGWAVLASFEIWSTPNGAIRSSDMNPLSATGMLGIVLGVAAVVSAFHVKVDQETTVIRSIQRSLALQISFAMIGIAVALLVAGYGAAHYNVTQHAEAWASYYGRRP